MSIHLKTIFCLLVIMTMFANAYSQESDKKDLKKVVIIKKINDNGKISETRTEAEGKEAEELLNSISPDEIEMMDVENAGDGQKVIKITKSSSSKTKTSDHKGDKSVEITSEIKDGKNIEKYKIIKMGGDGEKVMEWDGEGEMPEELEKELKNININRNFDGENMEISIDAEIEEGIDDRQKIVIRGGDEGGRRNRMMFIDKDDKSFFPERAERFDFKSEKPNTNKASLGVMIDDTDYGVVIDDMVDGSAASMAGLRRGDVILKINDTYIFTANGLLEALKPYNPNEKVKVKYIREGKEKSTNVVLKSRK
jgi:PDZ domain